MRFLSRSLQQTMGATHKVGIHRNGARGGASISAARGRPPLNALAATQNNQLRGFRQRSALGLQPPLAQKHTSYPLRPQSSVSSGSPPCRPPTPTLALESRTKQHQTSSRPALLSPREALDPPAPLPRRPSAVHEERVKEAVVQLAVDAVVICQPGGGQQHDIASGMCVCCTQYIRVCLKGVRTNDIKL